MTMNSRQIVIHLAGLPKGLDILAEVVMAGVEEVGHRLEEGGDWQPMAFFHGEKHGEPVLELTEIDPGFLGGAVQKIALAGSLAAYCERMRAQGRNPLAVAFVTSAWRLKLEGLNPEQAKAAIDKAQREGLREHPQRGECVQVSVMWRAGTALFQREIARVPGCAPHLVGEWENHAAGVTEIRDRFAEAIRPALSEI